MDTNIMVDEEKKIEYANLLHKKNAHWIDPPLDAFQGPVIHCSDMRYLPKYPTQAVCKFIFPYAVFFGLGSHPFVLRLIKKGAIYHRMLRHLSMELIAINDESVQELCSSKVFNSMLYNARKNKIKLQVLMDGFAQPISLFGIYETVGTRQNPEILTALLLE